MLLSCSGAKTVVEESRVSNTTHTTEHVAGHIAIIVMAEDGTRVVLNYAHHRLVYVNALINGRQFFSSYVSRALIILMPVDGALQRLVCVREDGVFHCTLRAAVFH